MAKPSQNKPSSVRRSCLGCLGRAFLWLFPLLALAVGSVVGYFLMFPPFGTETTARVLLVGLDEPQRIGGSRRADSIILQAARLDGSGAVLLSVPRDARVATSGFGPEKINAAYTRGQVTLLREVLADPQLLGADLPYHVVFDSSTVRAVVDALGGIEVTVPRNMDYDDNWGNLHIHLKAGTQTLNGEQAVGYLRWRKNNHGGGSSDDFHRTERQREVLIAMKERATTWAGIRRLPAVYRAFRRHSETNLTLPQLLVLGLNSQQLQSEMVPGQPLMRRGISYVDCDWRQARTIWEKAVE